MPRLPTANDLGTVTMHPVTGVEHVDLSAPYRAAQQLVNQVTQIAGEVADDQNRLDLGKAQTAWLQGQADTHASFEKDNDYATMQQRYGQQMQKVTDNASNIISSPRMRQEFSTWANQQNIRGGEQIRELAWGKEKDSNIASLNQALETSQNTYMSTSDPAARQQILDATNNMIHGAAAKNYIDQTQAQQIGRNWITNAATGSLKMMTPEQRISALQNPTGIVNFLPPDQRQEMLKSASYESLNTRLSQQQFQMYTGDAGMNALSVPDNTLLQAVFQQESGNRQRNPDGSVVMSPKGALGAGQIMPPTGSNPGFNVKPLQDNSEQENRRFTSDYLGAMLKHYNGNQILALAAYNAGPGQVDDWIKKIGDPRTGQITNEQFAASIPSNETRNYVYSVSANAQRMGNIQSVINSPEFKLLDGQQQAQIASRTLQIQDQADSAYRINIQQRMTDDAARANSGIDIDSPVTEAEFIRSIPASATPAEREQYYQQWGRYKDALSLQPVNHFVMQNSAMEGFVVVQALKPTGDESDYQFKAQQYAQAVQNYQHVINQRESDPAGWLAQNSDVVKSAYQSWQKNPTDGNAGQKFIAAIQSEKNRLGIKSNKVIPDSLADQISATLNSENTKYSDIQGILSGYGRFSGQVIAQVQNKLKGPVGVALGVNDPNAASLIFNLKNTSTSALRDSISNDNAKASDTSWNSYVSDISPTFASQQRGGPDTLNDINEQGKRLSYYYVSKGMSPDAAAKRAHAQILGDHYVVHDTWRMPNSLNLNEQNVADGLSHFTNELKPSDIGSVSAAYNPAMTPEMNAANNLAMIKNSAEWVTDENEQGVYLTVNGTYVNDKSGNPIHVPFTTANQLGVTNPGIINRVETRLRTPTKITPADKFVSPKVNATMDDAFRIIRGEQPAQGDIVAPDNPSNTLRDALSHRGGQ